MAKQVIYDGRDWKYEEATVVSFDRNENGHLHVLIDFVGVDGNHHNWHFVAAYNDDIIEAALIKAVEAAKAYPDGEVLITCGYQCGAMIPPRIVVWDGTDDE